MDQTDEDLAEISEEKLKQLDKRVFYAIDLEISDILFNRGENI
jgi:hypothetical protein